MAYVFVVHNHDDQIPAEVAERELWTSHVLLDGPALPEDVARIRALLPSQWALFSAQELLMMVQLYYRFGLNGIHQ